jgi:hypothetical protein
VQANIGMNGRYDSKTLPFMLCHVVPGGSTMNVMRTMAAIAHMPPKTIYYMYCREKFSLFTPFISIYVSIIYPA